MRRVRVNRALETPGVLLIVAMVAMTCEMLEKAGALRGYGSRKRVEAHHVHALVDGCDPRGPGAPLYFPCHRAVGVRFPRLWLP